MADSLHSLRTTKRASEDTDRVRDMAAVLFAELFYKQCTAEHGQKRRHSRGEEFDSRIE